MADISSAAKSQKRNFFLLLIDSFGWPLGMSFVSSTTILPLFLKELGASNLIIGLLPAIASLASTLPQLFVANYLESLPVKKRYVVIVGVMERLPFLASLFITLAYARSAPEVAIWGFMGLWALACFGQGINLPAYFGMMSKAIPARWRGRLYGYGGAIGGLLGLVGAWGAGLALTKLPFPNGFAVCFGAGFAILLVTLLPLGLLNEPPSGRDTPRPTTRDYLVECIALFKSSTILSRYTLLQILIALGGTSAAFYTVHSLRDLGASTAQVAIFNGLGLVITTLANPLGGILADRHGHRKIMQWSVAICAASAAAAALAPAVWGMYIAFALYNLTTTGYGISTTMLLLDYTPEDRAPTYTAVAGTLSSPLRFAAPLIAGWMADRAGYTPVFVFGIFSSLVALGVLTKGMGAKPHNV